LLFCSYVKENKKQGDEEIRICLKLKQIYIKYQ
jgi:hypothetical protein